MKPIKICSTCGFKIYDEKDLEFFTKDKRRSYGRRDQCKKCTNKYNVKWEKDNNYSVINTETRIEIIQGFGNPVICYFCKEPIKKLTGRDKHSLAIHSLDSNHDNWNPNNKVSTHNSCHIVFHRNGKKPYEMTDEIKNKIRKTLTGRKLTMKHKNNIRNSLIGDKCYKWKGDKAKPSSIRVREWKKKKRLNQT